MAIKITDTHIHTRMHAHILLRVTDIKHEGEDLASHLDKNKL